MKASRYGLVLGTLVALAAGGLPAPALGQSMSASQLDKLVGPIALYPDPLLAQLLPASTFPIQVVEAAKAVATGSRPDQEQAARWDPSVQALVSFPTVLKMMSDKLDWTTKLGEEVALDQGGVMSAIQRVRAQVQRAGNLKSNDRQTVTVKGSGSSQTIIIEPANPQVIYVPQYNPVAVLQPVPVGYYGYAAPAYGLMTFGLGFAAGAATAYACHWGSYGSYGSVTVNNNYHYNVNNTYPPYSSTAHYNSATGSTEHYNSATGSSHGYNAATGSYHGYDAKTGTYGAYNPATGKYGTYNPSTGAYNRDGQTGTYHPPSSTSSGSTYHAPSSTSSGSTYHAPSSTGSTWHPQSSSNVTRQTDDYRSAYHSNPSGGDSWGSHSGGSGGGGGFGGGRSGGGDAFGGLGGGGWGSREASDRGFRSFGGGFGGGDRFGGGGGGGGFGGRRRW